MMNNEDYLNFDDEDFMSESFATNENDVKYRAMEVASYSQVQAYHRQPLEDEYFAGSDYSSSGVFTTSAPNKKAQNLVISIQSSCPQLPTVLASTTFNTNLPFNSLKEKVDSHLKTETDFDSSFFSDEHTWICKYLMGSVSSEIQICCYKTESGFSVEVKRTTGEGLEPSVSEFFSKLKLAVLGEGSTPKKSGFLSRKPLPVPKLSRSAAPEAVPSSSSFVSKEQFLEGVQSIFQMSESTYMEPRLEAAKMMCDLAQKDKMFLELPSCRSKCLKCLESMVNDEFFEIKQFAIIAIASFAELEMYCELFAHSSIIIASLISHIRNSECADHDYGCRQMRRQSSRALSLISRNQPQLVHTHLRDAGHQNSSSWSQHVETLSDDRQRLFALEINRCFETNWVDLPSLPLEMIDSTTNDRNLLVLDSMQA